MAHDTQKKRERKPEVNYSVTIPVGAPSDIVERISQAHAKAESLIEIRRDPSTKKNRVPSVDRKSSD